VGTVSYIAPEIIRNKYGPAVDIWALGVIMYMMLAGYMPFYGKDNSAIMSKIMKGDYSLKGKDWDSVSKDAKDLLRGMLHPNPKKRLNAQQCMDNPWFNLAQRPIRHNGEVFQNLVNF
jgi:calcium-dependent protein kinase